MEIVDQKLGNVGEIKAELKDGKIMLSIEGSVDLVAQLEKFKAAHASGLLASIIDVAEGAIAKL